MLINKALKFQALRKRIKESQKMNLFLSGNLHAGKYGNAAAAGNLKGNFSVFRGVVIADSKYVEPHSLDLPDYGSRGHGYVCTGKKTAVNVKICTIGRSEEHTSELQSRLHL